MARDARPRARLPRRSWAVQRPPRRPAAVAIGAKRGRGVPAWHTLTVCPTPARRARAWPPLTRRAWGGLPRQRTRPTVGRRRRGAPAGLHRPAGRPRRRHIAATCRGRPSRRRRRDAARSRGRTVSPLWRDRPALPRIPRGARLTAALHQPRFSVRRGWRKRTGFLAYHAALGWWALPGGGSDARRASASSRACAW